MTLRTQSYLIGSQIIPKASIGQIDLQFSHRLSSIRSVFLAISNSAAVNGIFEAFDITQGNGEYSITIAGKMYPNRPHNTTIAHKNAILLELRKAVASLYNKDCNMSINAVEFNRLLSTPLASASSIADPGKLFVPFRCHVLPASSVFLSGQSSQDSVIGLKINCGTATAENATVNLISVYDMIINIDVNMKTCTTSV